jgi:hypothetical protein
LSEISGGIIYVKTIQQNSDIKVENTEFSTHYNPLGSPRKNVKISITPFAFIEQHTTGGFKQYDYWVKNLLIHYGRKAIFFPFQYFW